MTSESPLTLNSQKYPGNNFGPFHFTTNHFSDTKSSKLGNAPNNLRLVLNTVKGTLQAPVYLTRTNCRPLCSTASRFRDKRLSKIGNATYDLGLTNIKRAKSTLYTLSTYPKCPFLSVSLCDQVFSR